ncbi:zinc-binding dehydrogenase [Phytoactinopolyspora limicola]|uniref:zinc-binding dehydrogenase n=1 Tax=Phytoactinopolyspora limicola TaxID=2715536 RepID=UPI00140C0C90|nr:zinc-binding dehydrogenase [Phytoactinopolyspora limicola]
MRVVQATHFGGPEVLQPGEAAPPLAQPGHLVIEVRVAEILFLDTQLRSGWGSDYFPIEPPYVPGAGIAGTVVEAGADVDPSWAGRRVIAALGFSGGYAERVVVPVEKVVEVPSNVDLTSAIGALHDGPTALSRVEKAEIKPGDRVLVTAAGGSLGSWLIPLARAAGGHVVATARGTEKLEKARELGAQHTVDYTTEGWTDQVRQATGGHGVDVVFDGAGGTVGGSAFEITTRGGRFFAYGAASGDFAPIDGDEADRRGITVVGIDEQLTPEERERYILRGLAEIDAGTVRTTVGAAYPLEQAAAAHAAIEARTVVGKTVLTM